MSSNNVTNDNFVDISNANFHETISPDNIKGCEPKTSNINVNISDLPNTNIDMRNVNLTDTQKTFTVKVESGKNWNKETKTTYGPGYSETRVTYTYNGSEGANDINNNANMFFGNNANFFFEFLNNSNMPNYFNLLTTNDNSKKLKSAFEALSINEDEFKKLTKEQQEQKIKSAYHKAARKYHPDKNMNDSSATEKFQQLDVHKKILLDYIE